MWPPGHLAVGYLCYSLGAERGWVQPATLGVLVALAFGTQFPDLVDKPLAWYAGVLPGGRTLGHSLLFVVPLVATVTAVLSHFDRRALGIAFGVGVFSHVFVDAVPALWLGVGWLDNLLWPLFDGHTSGESESYTILGLLREQWTQPWFLFEYVVLSIAVVRWYRDGLPGTDELVSAVRDRTTTA